MSIANWGFLGYIALLILLFAFNLAKYYSKNHKLKWKAKLQLITIFVYSIGTSLFVFGVLWLLGLFSMYFSGNVFDSFNVYSLLATTITSSGLSLSIYLEQKLDGAIEKVEYTNDLSTGIASKIIDEVTERISGNIEELTNEVVKQTADNISLKLRPRTLRKEIAKQIVKSKIKDCDGNKNI